MGNPLILLVGFLEISWNGAIMKESENTKYE
jgi:hypothetical protein